MNISLKIVLIFCLVSAATAQDPPEGSGTDDTTTPKAPEGPGTGTTDTPPTASEGPGTGTTDAPRTGPCDSNPCSGGSTCEERFNNTFVCICQPGMFYNNGDCSTRKVFSAHFKFDETFDSLMEDKTSVEFQDKANDIENKLKRTLEHRDGYMHSSVLSLRNGSIIAEVQNFYELTSPVTTKTFEEDIQKAIENGIIQESRPITLCDNQSCDKTTTTCSDLNGITNCTCNDGYIMPPFISMACIACPNGERAVDAKNCEKCPFGFAGFNCNDPYLLVVVVVSTVLGALLIIFMVALIVVSCRNQKESSSPKVDFSSNYGNTQLHKPTGIPRIPRANPDASWKSNSLEMTNSISNQALVTRDRPESKTRYSDYEEDMSYRGHVPPPYSSSGGRGVENGGVQNPYFRPDDDRMRRY